MKKLKQEKQKNKQTGTAIAVPVVFYEKRGKIQVTRYAYEDNEDKSESLVAHVGDLAHTFLRTSIRVG